jgi:copper transport protein
VAAPVVVLSGLAGAWIQLGGLGPLGNSTYGRLLLLKLLLASVVLVLGWTNRRTLARVTTAALDLAASVRVEALLGLVVLAVSAVLVVTPPPSDEPVPVAVDATSGQLVVRAVVTPGVAGPNRVELRYLDTTGTPVAVDATDLRVSSVGVEPRRVEVRAVEPSVAVAEEVVLTPGPWRLEVTAVTRGEPTRFTLEVQLP